MAKEKNNVPQLPQQKPALSQHTQDQLPIVLFQAITKRSQNKMSHFLHSKQSIQK